MPQRRRFHFTPLCERKERINIRVLNASRRRRIASGAGVTIQDVNRLLKQFKQMAGMMKKVGKLGKKGRKALSPQDLQNLLPPQGGFPR